MKNLFGKRLFSILYLVSCGIAALLLGSCQSADKKPGWNAVKRMYFAPSDDAEMTVALYDSRKTVDQFIVALTSGDTAAYNFGIKAAFPTSDGTNEHIWLTDIQVKGDSLLGTIDNEPEFTTVVKFGQQVAVHKDSITDWNYTRNGKLVGGYSIRVVRSRLNPEEQKQFDQQLKMVIE
ncbi:YegJ family protein [Hymenobacter metallilatus]|uniref:DUF2314 domain-containing protein n=1 Tax=Hymenobacter metallilatus TaxID=2493666 RepID=A0A3R9NEN3_9BACT|nr:DUF2314 domain-containing protein [Hymenobacter metallilatus]RSK32395.1 DUF2314 domain-containing protein [Hymenobacter metallilatus]